jgi:hypothetical protein
MKHFTIYILFLFFYVSAAAQEKTPGSTLKCQLVEKAFVNKGGKTQGFTELYLRCSVQDYFIKLCESAVTKEELINYLDKGIEVEAEIKEGSWDICRNDPRYAQSRIGKYVVINKIVK